jgi:hypothetical protein
LSHTRTQSQPKTEELYMCFEGWTKGRNCSKAMQTTNNYFHYLVTYRDQIIREANQLYLPIRLHSMIHSYNTLSQKPAPSTRLTLTYFYLHATKSRDSALVPPPKDKTLSSGWAHATKRHYGPNNAYATFDAYKSYTKGRAVLQI